MTHGWDREPIQPPSVWLKLKTKGESVDLRIAAPPLREVVVWPEEDGQPKVDPELIRELTSGQWLRLKSSPDYKVTEVFPLLVIDRADGMAKIFRASGAIYSEIRKWAMNPKWGNPMGYDLTITRTEKPGSYWDVQPDPNKTDLMQSEVEKVKALNLSKLLPDAYPANEPQPDDFETNTTPEDLPWEKHLTPRTAEQEAALLATAEPRQSTTPRPTPAKQVDDVVIEDISDEPINLDDIPFN